MWQVNPFNITKIATGNAAATSMLLVPVIIIVTVTMPAC